MTLYPRQQLLVLLGLLAAAGAGLAVGQWRRAHPDLVARLEEFDRDPEATTAVLVPEPGGAHPGRPPRAAPPRATPLDVNRASAAGPSPRWTISRASGASGAPGSSACGRSSPPPPRQPTSDPREGAARPTGAALRAGNAA